MTKIMHGQEEMSADALADCDETLAEALERRIATLQGWLSENAPQIDDEQKHLDARSREQAYWHFGYLMALRDIKNCLAGKNDAVS